LKQSKNFLDKVYHIIDEINYLLNNSNNISYNEFINNETLKRAYVRSIEIIGEATKLIPIQMFELVGLNYSIEELLEEYPHLDRQKVIKIIEVGRDALNNLTLRIANKILEMEEGY